MKKIHQISLLLTGIALLSILITNCDSLPFTVANETADRTEGSNDKNLNSNDTDQNSNDIDQSSQTNNHIPTVSAYKTSGTQILLKIDVVNKIRDYYIYYKKSSAKNWSMVPATTISTSYLYRNIKGLIPNTEYDISAASVLDEIESIKSKTISVTTGPYAVTNISSDYKREFRLVEIFHADIKWNAVQNASYYEVYEMEYKGMYNSKWEKISGDEGVPGTNFTRKYIKRETEYRYYVLAVKDGIPSDPSDEAKIKIPVPVAPGNLKITSQAKQTSTTMRVILSWNSVWNITEYKIYYRISGTTGIPGIFSWNSTKNIKGTACTLSNLTMGKKYEFAVVSCHPKNGYSEKTKITYKLPNL